MFEERRKRKKIDENRFRRTTSTSSPAGLQLEAAAHLLLLSLFLSSLTGRKKGNVSVDEATEIEERERKREHGEKACAPETTLKKKAIRALGEAGAISILSLLTEFATSSSSSSTRRRGAEPLGPSAAAPAAVASILECGARRRQGERESREGDFSSLRIFVKAVFLSRSKKKGKKERKKENTPPPPHHRKATGHWISTMKISVVYIMRERRSPIRRAAAVMDWS